MYKIEGAVYQHDYFGRKIFDAGEIGWTKTMPSDYQPKIKSRLEELKVQIQKIR